MQEKQILARTWKVVVGVVLKKLEVLGPSRDAQDVCAVAKGGAVLKEASKGFIDSMRMRVTHPHHNLSAHVRGVDQNIFETSAGAVHWK